ncbi:N-6 DNA methylase [Aeromonas dhakensis]|uniref:N-6 DNA methylase n=1 Tax=Aeromonas dhakensis TaxID=196024 RepID=UPI003986468D
MIQLAKHNESLRDLIASSDKQSLSQAIDLDTFDMVLRECLSIEEMKEAGCFFTGQSLASNAVSSLLNPITPTSVVLDPTCGAGNLLIECSRQLSVDDSLYITLKQWGKILWGFDLYPSFIDATKLRLIVEAITRGAKNDCSIEVAMSLLSNIRVQDALEVISADLITVTHAVMNPPFTIWQSPKINYWKDGKVNAAGIVFDKYLRILPQNSCLSAILPDVLRSGSRYTGFRDFVDDSITGRCHVWGRFNAKTDVDVFVVSGLLKTGSEKNINWLPTFDKYEQLSDLYDVCIGPLVAYRDPEEGEEYPYFHIKNSPAWSVVTQKTESRRFSGRVFSPPIVVIKRTSSPSDKYRASATIINLDEAVAVENHMIVVQPKSKKLLDCERLLNTLKSESTNAFLNERIRLRHLTVSAVKEIPL